MRTSVVATGLLGLTVLMACSDDTLVVTAPAPPALSMEAAAEVEAIVSGSMAPVWRASHGAIPGAALSTAADAHTSSWRNWGMLDAGAEPRAPLNVDPEYRYNITEAPWTELYRALASARDVLTAIDAGVTLGEADAGTRRAVAFAKLVQGMALGELAELFSAAFILDEQADPSSMSPSAYPDVRAAALSKLDEALAVANTGEGFVIPAAWVGFDEDWDRDMFVRLVHSYRARITISVARTPQERASVDWAEVLDDLAQGITRDWAGFYDGDYEQNWAWGMDKLWAGVQPDWARLDYRTIGPADASGAWEAWINTPPPDRRPFLIDTDDRRVTGGLPDEDGLYVRFEASSTFRPERGMDHFSFYADARFAPLLETEGVGRYVDFPVKELDLIRAEALFHLGDRASAMELVNRSRARGGLPPFSSPGEPAPGGERCVPQRADGACGGLWEALKYEKRIELYHYGPFTEYLDDRGWGDLVPGTFREFPAVGASLEPLLVQLYGSATVAGASDQTSASALHDRRLAYDAFDRARSHDPGDVAGS